MYSPFLDSLVNQVTQPFGQAVGQLGSAFGSVANVGLGFVSPGSGPGLSSSAGAGYMGGLSSNLNLSPAILTALGVGTGNPYLVGAGIGGAAGSGSGNPFGASGVLTQGPSPGNSQGAPYGTSTTNNTSPTVFSGILSSIGKGALSTGIVLIIGIGALAFAFFGRND